MKKYLLALILFTSSCTPAYALWNKHEKCTPAHCGPVSPYDVPNYHEKYKAEALARRTGYKEERKKYEMLQRKSVKIKPVETSDED